MGGDSLSPPSSAENCPLDSDASSDWDHSCDKLGNNAPSSGKHVSLDALLYEAEESQKAKVFSEVIKTYEDMQSSIDRLEEARKKILSYKPGLWADNSGSVDVSQPSRLNCTTLLVIGPRGSGKSTLINKIYRVLESDASVSGKAQVSCNSSVDGTCFLSEYRIQNGSGSFCLYDTRSLSDDLLENEEVLERWMRQGVRHGELVQRKSDDVSLMARTKQKSRRCCSYSKARAINFVIFVVNGLSVLESMMSPDGDKTEYSVMISATFHNAVLSFQDDKPVVVVTHGDLLPLAMRAKIRIFLGSLLGIPPASQIFDVPDSDDPASAMAVLGMLTYSLEHADRYLHSQNPHVFSRFYADHAIILWHVLVCAVMAIAIIYEMHLMYKNLFWESDTEVDWHKIRHLWSD